MINIPKGTKDVLPSESYRWQYLEGKAKKIALRYGLKEVRTPTFEHTELFARGVGDTTDIVNKEMYTFLDKGGRSITLKPEGTAGAGRMFIENGLSSAALPVKMFYLTPCFRYERPQAGRLREFHQFGVEVYGSKGAETDAEVILLADAFLKELGLSEVELEINSIGCKECRKSYNEALKGYFRPNLDKMCPTCQSRFEKNPLRMLDCKEEGCKVYTQNAPSILDYLCPECKEHFETLRSLLDEVGLQYTVNPRIVRGLDYYSKTVFEFVSTAIGAQGTVCGGGRYDTLIESLGGPAMPAVGFAAGLERLILLMENTGVSFGEEPRLAVYFAGMDEASRKKAFSLAEQLRRADISCDVDHMNRSVKAQFKYAGKIAAKYVATIGSNELAKGVAAVKCMATSRTEEVPFAGLADYFKKKEEV